MTTARITQRIIARYNLASRYLNNQTDEEWTRLVEAIFTSEGKPTYQELADAFAEYLAATNNDGALPFGLEVSARDAKNWEAAIERASTIVDAAGGTY